MRLFWLTRYVGWLCLVMAIALDYKIMVIMAISSYTWLSVKRLRVLFACIITFSCFINVITMGSLWYMILGPRSWPSEIKFESHLGAGATLCNSILLSTASGIKTMPIFSLWITYLTTVTKSMFFTLKLLNIFQLLQRWRDIHKSRN